MLRLIHLTVLAFFLVAGQAVAQAPALGPAVSARNGMVVAQEGRAARIGVEVLEQGGNAVDAAVAIGFAMAVTYPRAGNIGGGGYMVIHLAGASTPTSRSTIARPRRRRPPATSSSTRRARPTRASRAIRRSRSACPARSRGWRWRRSATAPGKFTLAELIAPAIKLARDGFPIEDDVADSLPGVRRARGALAVVGEDLPQADGSALAPGDTLVQTRSRRHAGSDRAARATRLLRRRRIAEKLAAAVRAAGGIMTTEDLQELPADRAPAGARHLSRLSTSSRCRRRPRAAWC